MCKDETLWASHPATFIKSIWFMWNGGWRGDDTFLRVRAPACVRELCRCRLRFSLGNREREVERVSSQVHTTRTVKSIWRFLLLLQAGLTYIKEAIPMLISFLPLPSKHLHQNTSTIIPDIFGSLPISKHIPTNTSKHHLHPAIPNLYFSLIMNPSSSRYVPLTSSPGILSCGC